MKAMIFAAGLGTRLKPFTERHPKALVTVGGVPMLRRVLENIAGAGVTQVVVNVHHFATQITDYLQRNNNFGMNISISDETDCLLDTGGGLLKARDLLMKEDNDEPILLHNADILTDCPLSDMLSWHQNRKDDVTLLCSHRASSRTLYFSRADHRLTGWCNLTTGETRPAGFSPISPADSAATPFGGVHIVNPGIFPLLAEYCGAELRPFSIIPFYLENIARLNIGRFLLPDGCRWHDVGSSEKLLAAEQDLSSTKPIQQ